MSKSEVIILYRLKQVDFNGVFEYSSIKMVNYWSSGSYQLFPNPVIDELTIQWDGSIYDDLQVEVFDLAGRLISAEEFSGRSEQNKHNISLQKIESGIYIVRLSSGNSILFQEKLIKN